MGVGWVIFVIIVVVVELVESSGSFGFDCGWWDGGVEGVGVGGVVEGVWE